jgi:hypothetical protein
MTDDTSHTIDDDIREAVEQDERGALLSQVRSTD